MNLENNITITTIADNNVAYPGFGYVGLLGEHGLSFLIKINDRTILFDTGSGSTIIQNAEMLEIDWMKINAIVLSHAHRDHVGGLEKVLMHTGPLPIYVQPDIFLAKVIISNGNELCSDLPKTKSEYENMGAQFITHEGSREIFDGCWLIGHVNRLYPTDDEKMPNRYIKHENTLVSDQFKDEQFLAIKTGLGLILILGCTHNGIINSIEKAIKCTGEKKINAIIGGLHLCESPQNRLHEIAFAFKNLNLKRLICCHCTGPKAVAEFYCKLGDRVSFNYVGNQITIKV